MTDDLQTVEIVFLGERLDGLGKLSMSVITRSQLEMLINGNAGNDTIEYAASLFTAKAGQMPRSVGHIYSADARIDDDGKVRTLRTGTAAIKWVGDGAYDLAGAWRANHEAAKMRRQAKIEEAKAGKNDPLEKAIDTLIWHYRKMGAQNRNAFKVMILDRLDKGK